MHRALVPWTLGYLVGVLLGTSLGCSAPLGRTLSLFSLAALLLVRLRRGPWPVLLPLVALTTGVWAQAPRRSATPPPTASTAISSQTRPPVQGQPTDLWLLEGTILSDVRSLGPGMQFLLREESREPLGRWPGSIDSATQATAHPTTQARWLVRILGEPIEPLWPSDRIRIAAPWRALAAVEQPSDRPRESVFPGAEAATLRVFPDAVLRLSGQDAGLVAAVRQTLSIGQSQPSPTIRLWLFRRMAKARVALLRASLRAWSCLPAWVRGAESPSAAAFVQALTLGERGALRHIDNERQASGLPAWEAQIKDAGVLHILSVSGLHMSAVGLVFFALMDALLRRLQGLLAHQRWTATWIARRWAAAATLPVVVAYTLISGAEPPAVRAAGALVLFLLGQVFRRQARLPESLAVALLWTGLPLGVEGSPSNLFSPSLILSFAATLGIAYLRPLSVWLPTSWQRPQVSRPHQPRGFWPALTGLSSVAIRVVIRLLDASLSALLATMPLLAHYFGECQGAALIGNFLLTPLAELVTLPCGLFSALLALTWTPLALPFAALAAASARLVLALSTKIAGLGLTVPTHAPGPWLMAIWFLGLLILCRRRSWGLAILTAALLGHLASVWFAPRDLKLTFLDVGQGDAAVAELPDGGVLVIDAGRPGLRRPGSPASDAPSTGLLADSGQATVGPFLRRRGHRRIDLLVVSHRHPDHMGGVASLLSQFDVDVLWLTQQPAQGRLDREAERLDAAEASIRRLAQQRGTLVAVPHSRLLFGARLDVLSPCPDRGRCRAQARSSWAENDNSLVLALRYAGRTVLLTGDIEQAAEAAIVEQQPPQMLKADVLKLPHHGSRTSSTEPLLRAVQPTLAVASLGRQNRFGFPHPEVVQRLSDAGIPLVRTDESGAVCIQIRRSGALQSPLRSAIPHRADQQPDRTAH